MKFISKFLSPIRSLANYTNILRILRYIELFGLVNTYHEFRRKLLSDNYISYKKSKVNHIKRSYSSRTEINSSTISVVIPTKNAGSEFNNLLSAFDNQIGFKNIEIVVVDSASDDNTVEIAETHKAQIIKINPENFTHSYARNVGAKKSSGDFILFTVQDAYPTHDSWLYDLLSIMIETDVSAISCMELPREDSDLFYRAIIWNHSLFMETGEYGKIMEQPDNEDYISIRKNAQINNVACIVPRNIFMKYLFKSEYAEDLELGIRLIKDGHKLALTNKPQIIHSHNRTPYYHLKRGYVEQISYSRLFPDFPVLSKNLEETLVDISNVYSLLSGIVLKEFADIKTPCSVRSLSRFIINKLNFPNEFHRYNLKNYLTNKYLDENTEQLLNSISSNTSQVGNTLIKDCLLLDTVRSYFMIVLEYTYNNYNIMDNKLIEEVKSALFKSFALITGKFLGSCYINDKDTKAELLRNIDLELREGI